MKRDTYYLDLNEQNEACGGRGRVVLRYTDGKAWPKMGSKPQCPECKQFVSAGSSHRGTAWKIGAHWRPKVHE